MTPGGMEPFLEPGDIALAADREDIQIKAVEMGASCLILTCGAQIGKGILGKANENGCVVMGTAYDTFTAARLIIQSIPVGFIMTKKNIVSFHIDDYIDSIRGG